MTESPRPCRPEDLFVVSPEMPAEDLSILRGYLSRFAAPVVGDRGRRCVHCGTTINSMMEALGFGAAFKWGLAHGEAAATCCGAPARGYHRITRGDGSVVVEFGTFFLEYLPEKSE